ncbi:MAG: polyprenyl synthetase family protein, partial [Planctomycetota bacterium]
MLSEAPSQATAAADPAVSDVDAIEAALTAALADAPGRPARLMEAMRYAVLGPGKRLRPRLVLLGSAACGGDRAAALPAACAVEFVHAYSLIHDDLPAMDDDDLRRGRPTVHKQFDEATAILAGDALLALAFETLAASGSADACRELGHAAGPAALVGGQADDLAGAEGAPADTDGALEHLQQIHRRKTGAMITVSLRLGALSADATAEQLDALTTYGNAVGLLFQVTDD